MFKWLLSQFSFEYEQVFRIVKRGESIQEAIVLVASGDGDRKIVRKFKWPWRKSNSRILGGNNGN